MTKGLFLWPGRGRGAGICGGNIPMSAINIHSIALDIKSIWRHGHFVNWMRDIGDRYVTVVTNTRTLKPLVLKD